MEKKSVTWKGRLFLIGGAIATVAWAITLYWSLVAHRVIDSPWTL